MAKDRLVVRSDAIADIAWFSTAGEPTAPDLPFEAHFEPSGTRAVERLTSDQWEATTLEARNRLTAWLRQHHPGPSRQWNELVVEAKVTIERDVVPHARTLATELGGGDLMVDAVRWDVLHVAMEETYGPYRPPRLFDRLLALYRAGRLPCGWDGDVPAGSLWYH